MKSSRRLITTAVCCAMLICALIICAVASSAAGANKFTDVPEAWYTNAVLEVNELGIMTGTSKTTFEPLNDLTRAEYVTILFRLSGGEKNLEFGFTDVPDNAWYKECVGWAEQAGIINGYNGDAKCFAGDEKITREQLMVMTSRYMKYEWISFEDSADASEFNDKDKIAGWATDGVDVTRRAGLIKGDNYGNFNPQNNATRAEIATIVSRYLTALPNALDEMFMKIEYMDELVECENGNPVLTFGKWLPTMQNRADALGDQLLPQMGLDGETYELVMTDEDYLRFKDTYESDVYDAKISDGEAFTNLLTFFSIRNKQTGEETETYFYLCNVYFDALTIDPWTYDVGISEDIHAEMLETGVHSTGNIARLASAFAKAEAGEDLNVSYIGGSITAGGGADNNGNWVSGVTDWLAHQFPSSKVTGYNAGVGGTGSKYGILRLQNQVLNHDPDIVFVEFSANDSADESFRESFEALVRTCLEYDEDTAVVIVLVANANKDKGLAGARKNHFEFAEYYDLPIVDIHLGVHVGIDAGAFAFDEEFTHDGAHPTTWGHMVMSDIVEHFLSVIMDEIVQADDNELKISALPEMMCADTYIGFKTIDPENTENIVSLGAWKQIEDPDIPEGSYSTMSVRYDAWECSEINSAPLTFKFTGSELYLMMHRAKCVTVTVSDGKNTYVYEAPETAPNPVFTGLEEKEYTVTITMTSTDTDEESGDPVTPNIYAIVYR